MMKRLIKRGLLASSLLVVSLLLPAKIGAQEWGTVQFVMGEVTIERDGKSIAAKINGAVEAGDIMRTGDESIIHLLQNNNVAKVEISENTRFEIKSSSISGKTETKLWEGRIIASIKKIMGRREVRFETPIAVASIRGTKFSLSYNKKNNQSVLSVYKGLVAFSLGKKVQQVAAGQRAVAKARQLKRSNIPAKEMTSFRQTAKWDSLDKRFYAKNLSVAEKEIQDILEQNFYLERSRMIGFRDSVANLSSNDRQAAIEARRKELSEKLADVEKEIMAKLAPDQREARARHLKELERKRLLLKKHLQELRDKILQKSK